MKYNYNTYNFWRDVMSSSHNSVSFHTSCREHLGYSEISQLDQSLLGQEDICSFHVPTGNKMPLLLIPQSHCIVYISVSYTYEIQYGYYMKIVAHTVTLLYLCKIR